MNRKLLKSTLPICGALVCSSLALADVQLNNGAGTVSWDDFAAVINGTKSVEANADDFKKNNPNNDAVVALATANENLSAATTAANEADAAVTTAQTALDNANTALKPLTDAITEAQNTLDQANAELAQWNTQLSEYNNAVTLYSGQVTNYGPLLDDAKDELADAQKAYDDSAETKDITTVDPDYEALDKAATDYQNAWENYDGTEETSTDIDIWYHIVYGTKNRNTLYISFLKPDENAFTWEWDEATSVYDFDEALYPEQYPNGLTIATYKVYWSKYTATSDHCISVTETPNLLRIIQQAVSQITALAPKYTTTTTETTHNDPGGKLKEALDDAQKKVDDLTADRRAANANLSTANQNVADTQKKIDDYTKTVGTDGLTKQQSLQNAVEKAKSDAADEEAAVAEAQTAYDNAVADASAKADAKTAAQTKVTEAEAGVQTAANNAAKANYNRITLTGNETASTPITVENFTGTIIGGGFTITNTSGSTLFDGFAGRLSNAAINGPFANFTTGASFNNVAYWPGNNSNGAYYDQDNVRTSYSDLGALGFETRDNGFGVDFAANQLTSLAVNKDSKVYSFTVYTFTTNNSDKTPNVTPSVPNYAVINSNGDIVTAKGNLSLPVNTFAQSATDDVEGMELTNVFYGSENNYVADNVVITDAQNFCSPVELTAKTLNYARSFSGEMTTACLPFEISKDLHENITAVCTFDKAGTHEGQDVFWFTKKKNNETIAANTPAVIIAKGAFTLPEMNDVVIAKTDKIIVSRESDNADDNCVAFGNFKRVNVTEFAGEYDTEMGKMYGLQNGTFVPAGSGATFPAFRMVIKCEQLPSTGAKAPRHIRILDEDGQDITDVTTGIYNVSSSEMDEFEVIGGYGEIIFNTDADFGNVPVYSMEGKMVRMADIHTGTTRLNLDKGIYIVMGKKVMVK